MGNNIMTMCGCKDKEKISEQAFVNLHLKLGRK